MLWLMDAEAVGGLGFAVFSQSLARDAVGGAQRPQSSVRRWGKGFSCACAVYAVSSVCSAKTVVRGFNTKVSIWIWRFNPLCLKL